MVNKKSQNTFDGLVDNLNLTPEQVQKFEESGHKWKLESASYDRAVIDSMAITSEAMSTIIVPIE
ncbi:MAG: hypothetical protein ACYCY6_00505 [Minisyncoccota bacterium]